MNYTVYMEPAAEQDLRNIYEYIAHSLHSPMAAGKTYDQIKRAIMSLEIYPQRYNFLQKDVWKIRQIRCMPVAHFLLFYIVDEQKKTVSVLRIVYSKRNINQQI